MEDETKKKVQMNKKPDMTTFNFRLLVREPSERGGDNHRHPRVWVRPGAGAADDREPGGGSQDGHPLGSHLRHCLQTAGQQAHGLAAG